MVLCHGMCCVQHSLWAEPRVWGWKRCLCISSQPPWQWGKPVKGCLWLWGKRQNGSIHRAPDLLSVPTLLLSPAMLFLGNKLVACSLATCTHRPLTLSPIEEGEPAPSLSPGACHSHRLVYLPGKCRDYAACQLSPLQGLLSGPGTYWISEDGTGRGLQQSGARVGNTGMLG